MGFDPKSSFWVKNCEWPAFILVVKVPSKRSFKRHASPCRDSGFQVVFVRKLHFGRSQQHGRRRKGPVPRGSKTTHPESLVLMGIRCVVLETGPFRRRPCCLGQLLEPSSRSLRVFGRIIAFYRGDLRGGVTSPSCAFLFDSPSTLIENLVVWPVSPISLIIAQ